MPTTASVKFGPAVSAQARGAQAVVAVDCPYCRERHEISVEKGRSGKLFLHFCTKCNCGFALRLVPVTHFEAEVTGFR